MKENDEEKIKEVFLTKLKQSGYSFENQIEKDLKKDFRVMREIMYLDKDEKKGRTLDFKAEIETQAEIGFKKGDTPYIGKLVLPIECKSLPDHAWIFFKKDNHVSFGNFPDMINWKETKKMKGVFQPPLFANDKITYVSSCVEYNLKKEKSKSNGRTDNLFKAILSVTKATRSLCDQDEELQEYMEKIKATIGPLIVYSVYQPLIIFRGRMYVAEGEGENMELNSVPFVQIQKQYVSGNYNEKHGVIHIVNYENLDEYLKILKDHFRSSDEFQEILKDQDRVDFSQILDW